jgi:hypothetical protein
MDTARAVQAHSISIIMSNQVFRDHIPGLIDLEAGGKTAYRSILALNTYMMSLRLMWIPTSAKSPGPEICSPFKSSTT